MVGINLYIDVFITITGSIPLETARLLVSEATIHPVVSVSTLTWFTPVILVGSVLLTSLVFLFCFVFLRPVFCAQFSEAYPEVNSHPISIIFYINENRICICVSFLHPK